MKAARGIASACNGSRCIFRMEIHEKNMPHSNTQDLDELSDVPDLCTVMRDKSPCRYVD